MDHALKANTNLVGHAGAFAGVDAGLSGPVSDHGGGGIESAGELSPSARMRDRLQEVVRFESVVRLHALGNGW